MAKFERRFAGKDNAGLRRQIRRVATIHGPHECSPGELEQWILQIGNYVALTTQGRATLADVARDYRELAESRSKGSDEDLKQAITTEVAK